MCFHAIKIVQANGIEIEKWYILGTPIAAQLKVHKEKGLMINERMEPYHKNQDWFVTLIDIHTNRNTRVEDQKEHNQDGVTWLISPAYKDYKSLVCIGCIFSMQSNFH